MVFVSYLKRLLLLSFFVVRLIIGAYGPLFTDIIKFRQSGPSFLANYVCSCRRIRQRLSFVCRGSWWRVLLSACLNLLISFDSVAE